MSELSWQLCVCAYGGVSMSGGDGTNSSTQVPAVMCVWAPVSVLLCLALNAAAS
jgi:hypothetical protein